MSAAMAPATVPRGLARRAADERRRLLYAGTARLGPAA
jgi:hypothetical protein